MYLQQKLDHFTKLAKPVKKVIDPALGSFLKQQ